METIFFYCAAIGGGILVLQTLILVIGLGDSDIDVDIGPDVDADFGDSSGGGILLQLSLKTVIAFLTFFGLAGLACIEAEMSSGMTLTIATIAGITAFYMVAYLMRLLVSLHSSGNIDLRSAVGSRANVYLRIPEKNSGVGKITVAVQGRKVMSKAVTPGDSIPTGAEVIIQRMTSPDTFEVNTPQ